MLHDSLMMETTSTVTLFFLPIATVGVSSGFIALSEFLKQQ